MKKILLLTVCLFACNTYAKDIKPYVEGRLSQNWIKAQYEEYGFGKETFKNNVFGVSIEAGTQINQFRVGLEGYYNDKIKDNC